MYNKPVISGGVSRCVHCGIEKVRIVPEQDSQSKQNKTPRTVHRGCPKGPNGSHVYATEKVEHGWSSRSLK